MIYPYPEINKKDIYIILRISDKNYTNLKNLSIKLNQITSFNAN